MASSKPTSGHHPVCNVILMMHNQNQTLCNPFFHLTIFHSSFQRQLAPSASMWLAGALDPESSKVNAMGTLHQLPVFVRLSICLACCGRNDLGQPRPKHPLLISDLSFLNPIGFVWQSYLYLGVCLSVIFVCSIQNPVLMYCTITRRYWYIPWVHWGSATKALCCVRLFNEGAETCHASQSTVQILGKFVKGFSKQHDFDSPNQWIFMRKWHGHWDRLLLFYAATSPFWPVSTKDIPALRTVIIADTRPSGDISVLQAAMRSLRLHKSKANDTAQILQVASWAAFLPSQRWGN